MNPTPPDWPTLETRLFTLSRPQLAGVVVRAARRVAPAILTAETGFGAEAREWFSATASTLTIVEAFAQGDPVSGFTLLLAAECPRVAANAMATAARRVGPSPLIERVETALAAVAFAADLVRAATPERAVRIAMQSLTNADATEPGIGRLAAFDLQSLTALGLNESLKMDWSESGPLGELWPTGEPAGWTESWQRLEDPTLPRLIASGHNR